MSTSTDEPLRHRDRMRRVVLLCCSFARNVAFYRAGWTEQAQPFLSKRHPEAAFWRQVNANFLDMAVLDWCKLFGDQKEIPLKRVGQHHWRRVVSDPQAFELGLLGCLRLSGPGFAAVITKMRQYRDEFVAHLDDKPVMEIPELDAASEAVDYYHRHIAEREARPGELGRLPAPYEFALGYGQCADEAARVYTARPAKATT